MSDLEYWKRRARNRLVEDRSQKSKAEVAEAPSDLKEQLRKANQQFVDVSVALMKYVPESEAAAKSALQQLGDAHGYGWCQSALGKMWDEKHGCAPRGSMGVTVKDYAPQPTASNAGEREAFHAAMRRETFDNLERLPNGDYKTYEARVGWIMWQAALATKPPAGEQKPVEEYSGWYCAHCQRGVDGSEVTFHEQHTECGRVITNDRPPATQPEQVAQDKKGGA